MIHLCCNICYFLQGTSEGSKNFKIIRAYSNLFHREDRVLGFFSRAYSNLDQTIHPDQPVRLSFLYFFVRKEKLLIGIQDVIYVEPDVFDSS